MWRPKRSCALRKLFFIKNVFHELCPNLREQIALMSNMHSLSSKNFRKTACFFLFFSSKNLTVLYKNSVLFLFLSSKNVKVLHKKVFCFYFNPLKVLQFFRKQCVVSIFVLHLFLFLISEICIANSTDLSLSLYCTYQNLFQTIVVCKKVSFVKSRQIFLSLFLVYWHVTYIVTCYFHCVQYSTIKLVSLIFV